MKNVSTKFIWKFADALIFIILTLAAFACFYPFYYMLIYSLSDSNLVARGVYFIPAGFTFNNYLEILAQHDVLQGAFISISRTVLGAGLTVVCSSMFAYLLAQPKLPGRKFFYRLIITSMYVNSGLIPWFVVMKMYGLQNSFLLYIIPSAVAVFYVILCKTYIEQLPVELTEAAYIDGAGPVYIFTKIIFPLCRPVLATIVIFSAVDQWNTWMDNFYLVNTANLQTLQLTLLNYLTNQEVMATMSAASKLTRGAHYVSSPTSIRMAISLLVAAPILLVYPIFQKHFVKGILIGAVKG